MIRVTDVRDAELIMSLYKLTAGTGELALGARTAAPVAHARVLNKLTGELALQPQLRMRAWGETVAKHVHVCTVTVCS